jgi:hypothetical protein
MLIILKRVYKLLNPIGILSIEIIYDNNTTYLEEAVPPHTSTPSNSSPANPTKYAHPLYSTYRDSSSAKTTTPAPTYYPPSNPYYSHRYTPDYAATPSANNPHAPPS